MARLRPPAVTTGPDAEGVPVEFHDRDHPLWTGPIGPFLAYMHEHSWQTEMDGTLRLFVRACLGRGEDPSTAEWVGSPARRRQSAVVAWAREAGIMSTKWPTSVDFHRLRAMGLIG